MKKLKGNRGETLVESLVALLIAVLAFSFFVTASVTAGRINAKVKNTDVSFSYGGEGTRADVTLSGTKGTERGSVTLYENNGYTYYTLPQEGGGG